MDEIESAEIIASEHKNTRKAFSRIGLALFTILAVATALQLICAVLTRLYNPKLFDASWFTELLSLVPMYLIAFPLGYLILRPVPAKKPIENKISIRKLLEFLLMCFCIMYVGNLIGSGLSMLISDAKGSDFENPLLKLLESSNIYLNFLLVVIVAPIFEETVFRKLLVDRVRIYGEGIAILVSGLSFGLFHENLFQFFYAFGIGSMFAYIYLRTGRIRYSMILHSIINFFGGVLPVILTKYANLSAFAKLKGSNPQQLAGFAQNNLWQVLVMMIYGLAIISMFIGGLALLIDRRRKIIILPSEKQLEKGTRFKSVFFNVGMILFAILSLGLMVYSAIVI